MRSQGLELLFHHLRRDYSLLAVSDVVRNVREQRHGAVDEALQGRPQGLALQQHLVALLAAQGVVERRVLVAHGLLHDVENVVEAADVVLEGVHENAAVAAAHLEPRVAALVGLLPDHGGEEPALPPGGRVLGLHGRHHPWDGLDPLDDLVLGGLEGVPLLLVLILGSVHHELQGRLRDVRDLPGQLRGVLGEPVRDHVRAGELSVLDRGHERDTDRESSAQERGDVHGVGRDVTARAHEGHHVEDVPAHKPLLDALWCVAGQREEKDNEEVKPHKPLKRPVVRVLILLAEPTDAAHHWLANLGALSAQREEVPHDDLVDARHDRSSDALKGEGDRVTSCKVDGEEHELDSVRPIAFEVWRLQHVGQVHVNKQPVVYLLVHHGEEKHGHP
mmetsp:Transcript_32067/g.92012  ORF Transcript_32067/g.92012 Transcript_32067/m.92012 type:complete len:390 (+) Transcript_32067:1476-2645(+)